MVKRITVKDIARELDLSLGTINKALNGKPGISDDTRRKINETAAQMGYKVNRVAQGLARNTIRIGIIIPQIWLQYYGYLKIGIDRELDNLSDYNISGEYISVPDLHSRKETIEALDRCLEEKMDAVIICPAHESDYADSVNKLQSSNIPVIALGSDLKDTNRTCCIRINAYMSGMLAAEYMSRIVAIDKYVAVFIGNKDMSDHKEKADGFLDEARRRNMNVAGVYESHDEPAVAYYLTNKLIKERREVSGFYVATANSVAVCKYIEDNAIEGVGVIGTDLSPEICSYVEKEIMQGVIYQDMVYQGRKAIKTVVDLLVHKKSIEENIFVSPQLLLRSNLECHAREYKLYHDLVSADFNTSMADMHI